MSWKPPYDLETPIWTPDQVDSANKEAVARRVTVKGKILRAAYYPETGFAVVQVALPDGGVRHCPIHKSSFSHYHGRPYKETPTAEVDREMRKYAALLQSRKGAIVRLEADESKVSK